MATANLKKTKRVFVSHAVRDKALADALVDLAETGASIPAKDIFCSSLEGLGIPTGKDFITHIKEQIQQPDVVILLLSQNYFASQFCLCELGASWAMTHHILPLLVPPLTFDDVKGVLAVTQLDRIDNGDDLNRFLEALKAHLHAEINFARWEAKKKKFLREVPIILKELPKPATVPLGEHEALKKKYDDAIVAIDESQDEIEELQHVIEDLKKCKDAEAVHSVIREHSTGLAAVEAELAEVKKCFKKLPTVVEYVMFRKFTGGRCNFDAWSEREARQEAEKALEDGYLTYEEHEGFALNEGDPSIRNALKRLREAHSYLTSAEVDGQTASLFEQERGYELSLSNRRLWQHYLSRGISNY